MSFYSKVRALQIEAREMPRKRKVLEINEHNDEPNDEQEKMDNEEANKENDDQEVEFTIGFSRITQKDGKKFPVLWHEGEYI